MKFVSVNINLAEGVKINERSIPENIREQLIKRNIPVALWILSGVMRR